MGKLGLGCIGILVVLLVILGISFAGTYNRLVTLNQDVDRSWSEVENQYQRRADLVPNLVSTVQGAANFEKDTLTAVTEARASVGRATITPGQAPTDPESLARFQQAQDQLGSALQRLLVVSERYPELRANQNFRDLQAQLEGTENRITVAREPLQRIRPGLQHRAEEVPDQHAGRALRLQGEAVLQGDYARSGAGAEGPVRLRQARADGGAGARLVGRPETVGRRQARMRRLIVLSCLVIAGLAVAAEPCAPTATTSSSRRSRSVRHRPGRRARGRPARGPEREARAVRARHVEPDPGLDRPQAARRFHARGLHRSRGTEVGRRARSRRTTARSSSSSSRTGRCASRWATASRARCPDVTAKRIIEEEIRSAVPRRRLSRRRRGRRERHDGRDQGRISGDREDRRRAATGRRIRADLELSSRGAVLRRVHPASHPDAQEARLPHPRRPRVVDGRRLGGWGGGGWSGGGSEEAAAAGAAGAAAACRAEAALSAAAAPRGAGRR